MTAVLNHKGEEVISERHQKDFKKEYNTEKVTRRSFLIYLVLQILILMTFNLYS
jgi:hypothetical protein